MATGRKTVVVGQVIDPATWGNPLWDQSVQTFASAADRTAQFPAPKQGATTWLEDTKVLQVYDGAAWQTINAGRLVSTFTPDPVWVADGANPSRLTRIGGRWLLTVFVRNKNTGAINAGTATLGTVDPAACVASGLPSVRGGGFATIPTGSLTIGSTINTVTGVVSVLFPTALGTLTAGTTAIGCQLIWDAT